MYTDASGRGFVAAVLFDCSSSAPLVWSHRLPNAVRSLLKKRRNQIAMFELLAVIAGFLLLGPFFSHGRLTLHVDNQTALGWLRNGFCHKDAVDCLRLIALFWEQVALLSVDVDLRWVPSSANLADGPTHPGEAGRMSALESLLPIALPSTPVPSIIVTTLKEGVHGV